jgi:hypothetical protein
MTQPGQQQIEVDLLALQQSKEGIAENVEGRLRSGISSARGLIYRGVPVGERTESLEVDASRQAISYAMHCFWENTEAFMQRADQVRMFLAKMLEQYSDADDFAKMKVDEVDKRLRELKAVVQIKPEPTPVRGALE